MLDYTKRITRVKCTLICCTKDVLNYIIEVYDVNILGILTTQLT